LGRTCWGGSMVISQGIILLLDFASHIGHEQGGKRPALGIFRREYVVSMLKQELYNSDRLPGLMDISKSLEIPCVGAIPYDLDVHVANNAGVPVALNDRSYLAKTFDDIAMRIVE